MNLSSDLISQFVKATKTDTKVKSDTTMFGTIVYDGRTYVKLDGSDLLTPVSTTADVQDGERVTVMIKDHSAIVTGNMSSPAARTETVKQIGSQISEFEIVMAYKVTTDELEAANATIESLRAKLATITDLEVVFADIETLQAKFAELEYVSANDVKAINATIENLQAKFGDFTNISTEDLEALTANIETLRGYTADFTYVSAEALKAFKANIQELDTKKLSAEDAQIKYATIDFANIGEAAVRKLFSDSGLIKDLVVGDGTITGNLVGVTISGDLIEGNTIKADKLVVKGEDGLYYKLNFEGGTFVEGEVVPDDGLHGSVIVANTITAEKISVDDLVAFDATIGGFNITNNSLYSGVKETVDNTTQGVYLDRDGQFVIGDSDNFLRFFKIDEDTYKLEISASSLVFTSSGNNIEEELETRFSIEAGKVETQFTSVNETLNDLGEVVREKYSKNITEDENGISITDSDGIYSIELDNVDGVTIRKNGEIRSQLVDDNFYTGNIVVKVNERAQLGGFAFVPRSDGSLSFLKVGD